jgi:pyruvate dehydrogenase E2 component (dihydrolipoamide acetyltransferase)
MTALPIRRELAERHARKVARDLGVDLGTVTGSGPVGRIRADDVVIQLPAADQQKIAAQLGASIGASQAICRLRPR